MPRLYDSSAEMINGHAGTEAKPMHDRTTFALRRHQPELPEAGMGPGPVLPGRTFQRGHLPYEAKNPSAGTRPGVSATWPTLAEETRWVSIRARHCPTTAWGASLPTPLSLSWRDKPGHRHPVSSSRWAPFAAPSTWPGSG